MGKARLPQKTYPNGPSTATDFEDVLGPDWPAIEARRLDLIAGGYNPTPVNGKAAVLPGWQRRKPDEMDARRWSTSHREAPSTGLVLGEGLVAIDIDVTDRAVAAPLIRAADDLGDGAPLVRVGQAPKALFLYRTDRPLTKRKTGQYRRAEGEKAQAVEILADGQQFVAFGIHPNTGEPYQWTGDGLSPLDVPRDRLPLIDLDRLEGFMEMADAHLASTGWQRIRPATGQPDLPDLFDDVMGPALPPRDRMPADRCREILADLPPDWCDDRDTWIRAGMALQDELGEAGFVLWDEWSRRSRKYDPRHIRVDWKAFRPGGGVTMGSLIAAGSEAREARRRAAFETEVEALDDLPEKPAAKPSKIGFATPSACGTMPSRGYIVKGMLAPGDVACVFGEPGAGKSMIAPFLGYMVAQGHEAFGMRTKPGRVFYLPFEDETGMKQRVAALYRLHGDTGEFLVVTGATINTAEGLKDLLLEVRRQRPTLIVLDTLAAAFPGLEENSAEAMSRVVAVGRQLARFGAAVVFIHHSTKDQNGTPRGHSVLNGALDVSIELVKADEGGVVRGRLRKNRNGPCDLDIAFRIDVQELGIDEDGDPITAGFCQPFEPGSAPKALKLTPPQREALTILRDMVARVPDSSRGVPLDEWRAACMASHKVCASDNRRSVVTALRRAIEGLLRADLVIICDERARVNDHDAWTLDELDDLEVVG